jgi:hypothetical protein
VKTLRIIGLILQLALPAAAFGQSTFEMWNHHLLAGVDAPVFDAQGTPLAGTNYLAELWGGPAVDSLTPALDIQEGNVRLFVPFNTGGYFHSSHIATIGPVAEGAFAWLQVRAWDARLGGTYEEVAALGVGGYGESLFFYAQGGNPLGLPTLPGPLKGLQSFSLLPIVPEPSSWVLLGLGATAHWWAKRRRARR